MPESAQRKLSLAFSVGLVLLLAMGAISMFSIWRLVAADRWVTHTLEVRSELSSVLTGLAQAEAGVRGLRITGDTTELAHYRAGLERTSHAFGRLRTLTRDNAAQQRRLAALAVLIEQRQQLLVQAAALPAAGQVSTDAVLVAREGRALTARITVLADDLDTAERALLAGRTDAAARTARLATMVAVGLVVLAAVLALVGNRAIRRDFVGRLRAEQALRLAEQRYHVIFDQTFQLTYLLTAGGEVVDANETALTVTGLARDDLVGRALAALPC
jgi:CHASE3 domain sensor protein